MGSARVPTTNIVIIAGRVTWGPDLKMLSGDNAICKFGMAYNRPFKKRDGSKSEETFFVNVEIWGRPAEWANKDLFKGAKIQVQGSLKENTWQKDGKDMTKLEIKADKIEQLEWADDPDTQGATTDENEVY